MIIVIAIIMPPTACIRGQVQIHSMGRAKSSVKPPLLSSVPGRRKSSTCRCMGNRIGHICAQDCVQNPCFVNM